MTDGSKIETSKKLSLCQKDLGVNTLSLPGMAPSMDILQENLGTVWKKERTHFPPQTQFL